MKESSKIKTKRQKQVDAEVRIRVLEEQLKGME